MVPTPSVLPRLGPSPDFSGAGNSRSVENEQNQIGLELERPRSALHSGDFLDSKDTESKSDHDQLGRSTVRSSWLSTSPPRQFTPFNAHPRGHDPSYTTPFGSHRRAPSLSSSLSSSFVLQPPTSPLVHSQSHDDTDLSMSLNPIDITSDTQYSHRRHTLQFTHSTSHLNSTLSTGHTSRPMPALRRENSYPYQAHQPKRSLTLNSFHQPISSPETPLSRSRKSSLSETSPLHASMVGSYEESILRGRMSTTPSKPLDFVAQIGVLGLGQCKPSLRCPPHVTIPFPAVFYRYETTTHGRPNRTEDEPSPYVGQIDLESNLPYQGEEHREKARRRRNVTNPQDSAEILGLDSPQSGSTPNERVSQHQDRHKRRQTSPKVPLGGSYRIPEKGQLQIIIKNPNKTAVKLFLVPYDLVGMEPGTKTFIRQRSYSVGPFPDMKSAPTSKTSESLPADRPVLRYLVHLHICSPARGRFYLYKNIRIVFANRVPDGKEKLRNEISLPEPRFSVYKARRESGFGFTSHAGATLISDVAHRRRSAGFPLGMSREIPGSVERLNRVLYNDFDAAFNSNNIFEGFGAPSKISGLGLNMKENDEDESASRNRSPSAHENQRSPVSSYIEDESSWSHKIGHQPGFDKLSKGDLGYGGNIFGSVLNRAAGEEGLLARNLRHLDDRTPKGGLDGAQM